jgi:CheY-like chemotaxis protein
MLPYYREFDLLWIEEAFDEAWGWREQWLVVEDEQRVRHFAVDALRELGYTAVSAGAPKEALEMIDAQPKITLLFTDIVMPDMTGRQLADAALAKRPDLKVLYTTGYTRNEVVHNGMIDVGVAFLSKPYSMADLAHKVRNVLNGGGVNPEI